MGGRAMSKFAAAVGTLCLIASTPAHSIVSLHNVVCQFANMTGVDPVVAATGALILAGTLAYRLKKEKQE